MHTDTLALASSPAPTKLRLVFDMETSDPDDFLTLLWLLGRDDVDLRAVTITPGSSAQVGLVRRALSWFGRNIPVGAYNVNHPKECVSQFHYDTFGVVPPSVDAEDGYKVLLHHLDKETTLLTGAPLKNLGAVLRYVNKLTQEQEQEQEQEQDQQERELCRNFYIGRWVAQGGFAGDGVIPTEQQMEKFRGLRSCPTYNFNGDPKSALLALEHPRILQRRLVSKNVCHSVVYDTKLHEQWRQVKDNHLSLSRIWDAMDQYLRRHPGGKKFHDPLAACCAVDESIASWAEVSIFRERGGFGATLATPDQPTHTKIITAYQHEQFLRVLLNTI